ncbi:MAG: nuclear transport factor 2 family protein [Hyphomonadaceae bacterium]|nr:nuclear transport factor 2 family protein [Hyphomonadaceae bacterium]
MEATESSRKRIEDYARLLIAVRDPFMAFATYFGADLIQHDPDIGDGNMGDVEFLEARRAADPTAFVSETQYATVVHNILADGNLVALKSHCFTSRDDRGRVFVDMWRIEDGKFAEHWSAIEPIAASARNPKPIWCGQGPDYDAAAALGNSVFDPICGKSGDPSERAASLATVRAYLDALSDPAGVRAAVDRYVADDFVEWSPRLGQGKAALVEHLAACAARGETFREARFLADGNLVLLHGKSTSPEHALGYSQMHLFRVAGGKIVAHWAVRQAIPTYSVAGHTMVDGPLEEGRVKGPPPPGSSH